MTAGGDASADSESLQAEEDTQGRTQAHTQARSHPAGVPETASWVDDDEEWQDTRTDDAGLPHGPFRSWRDDGSLRTVASHDHGKQIGPAWRFHPDGSLFSLGLFVDGAPRGIHRRYANPRPEAERLQNCCVPPGAWQLRQDYSLEGAIDRLWFDRHGAPLLDSGEPYPARPPAVPVQARFHETRDVWEAGAVFLPTGHRGTRTRWSRDGVLLVIEELKGALRHGRVQSFSAGGALAWEGHFADDRLDGPFRAMDLPIGHFVDPVVRAYQGAFVDDQAQGQWQFFDGDGGIVQQRDLGLPLDRAALPVSDVLANEGRPAQSWRSLAVSLQAARRVGEALLASARATAASCDATDLTQALRDLTLPLGVAAATAETEGVVASAAASDVVVLVDALKRGGDAATLLWAIARTLQGVDRAALDFVTAALLLSPGRTDPLSTRTLLLGSLGQVDAARADIAQLTETSPDQATMLDLVLRAYFPRFDFWPHREPLTLQAGEENLAPARTASEVNDVIARYATRLQRLRAAVAARIGDDAPWLIPDQSALLPDGPVPLRRWTFTMSPDEYGGADDQGDGGPQDNDGACHDDAAGEPIEIVVDETQGLVAGDEDTTLFSLQRRARADWSALTWLCWAVGLDAPGLVDQIRPPATFGRAAVMTMERTWRCRDKLSTSGLLALTKGIPGFQWEGTPIDLVPSALVDVVLEEYLEARAIFSWLCDPANRSPWQDDLRGTD